MIDLFKTKFLDCEPGSKMKYSNSGYEVLGFIIAKVSGTPYDRLDVQDSGYDHRVTIIKDRPDGYSLKGRRLRS